MKRDSRVVEVKKRLKLKISTSFWRKSTLEEEEEKVEREDS